MILVAEVLEEGGHCVSLVGREVKVVREAATGDARRNLGVFVRHAADASDLGTYESVMVW